MAKIVFDKNFNFKNFGYALTIDLLGVPIIIFVKQVKLLKKYLSKYSVTLIV